MLEFICICLKISEDECIYRRNRKHLRLSKEPFTKKDRPRNISLYPDVKRIWKLVCRLTGTLTEWKPH